VEQFLTWVKQLRFDNLFDMGILVVAAMLSITIHETCHGLTAWWLGDPTAKRAGRLTLNPLKHIDLFGLVLLAVAKFGWAKPVPVDMRYFRNPKWGMALTALAGPLSNVLLALAALLVRSVLLVVLINRGGSDILDYTILLTEYLAIISSGLAVFNIIPIPPLDGSKILAAILPDRAYVTLMRFERYGMILLAILLLSNVIDGPLNTMRQGILDLLISVAEIPFYGLMKLFP